VQSNGKKCKKESFFYLNTMPNQFGKWTVTLLKKELAARGAKLTGRKSELIDRLGAYDRNDDFRGAAVIQPESLPMPNFPKMAAFRTLTAEDKDSVPKVRQAYLSQS
jgi:hypothetical protein